MHSSLLDSKEISKFTACVSASSSSDSNKKSALGAEAASPSEDVASTSTDEPLSQKSLQSPHVGRPQQDYGSAADGSNACVDVKDVLLGGHDTLEGW